MANIYHFGQRSDDARSRQELVDDLKSILDGFANLSAFPGNFKLALRDKVWAHKRQLAGGTIVEPISFHAFIHDSYPMGLGIDDATVKRLISDDIVAKAAYDEIVARESGNPTGKNQHTMPLVQTAEVGTVDNIHGSSEPQRPTGTSEQAGLRRLRKAAEAGDARAQVWLDDVLAEKVSVHRACVAMGWRKPTITLRDEPLAIFEAAVKKSSALETARRSWLKMSMEEQEQFIEWATKNMTTVMKSFA